MSERWLKKKCSKCTRMVSYLSTWITKPELCDRCRLSEIEDLADLLEKFLAHEAKLKNTCVTPEDKQLFNERQPIRTKVKGLLGSNRYNTKALIESCNTDRDLTRLVFRLEKERKLEISPRRGGKTIEPKSLAPFLQGGAPGLGKRSS